MPDEDDDTENQIERPEDLENQIAGSGVDAAIQSLVQFQAELDMVEHQQKEALARIDSRFNDIKNSICERRNEKISAIPDFWLTAFSHHPKIETRLTDQDREILKYLDSFDVKNYTHHSRFKFIFRENPFFQDKDLVKVVGFQEDHTRWACGDRINWNEGKVPPQDEKSFFNWIAESEVHNINFKDEIASEIRIDIWPRPLKYFNDSEEDQGETDDDGGAI